MNAPSLDIKDIMVGKGLGLTFGRNLFVGLEPANPPDSVTVFDGPGGGFGPGYNPEERYEYRAVNVRVRAVRYEAGMKLAQEIVKSLHKLSGTVVGQTLYTLIKAIDTPGLTGYDQNGRAWITFNLEIQRRPVYAVT